ncbi:MAG: NAD(P)-binding domain-containing protein [Verrucomicrobiota bacterium]|nr:NAD(P)-binding domain-containing protein [Verrucomicrobiota bacterium]
MPRRTNTRRQVVKIAVIGAGNVGTVLGRAWLKCGHEMTFGAREPDGAKARDLRKELPAARVVADLEAARASEVVVLATPWIYLAINGKVKGDFAFALLRK